MHIETNLKELALRTSMRVIYVRSYKVKPKYGSNKIKFAQYVYVYMRMGSIGSYEHMHMNFISGFKILIGRVSSTYV